MLRSVGPRLAGACLICLPMWAQLAPQYQLARDVFRQLIEINTTDSVGDNTKAAEAMAARFRDAGFAANDVQVLVPAPRKGLLVVRYHGAGSARPILFIGHLDVVEAKASDWSFDPFVFREQDGYFYGRGAQDMKDGDAALVTTFLRLKKEGYQPQGDLILALTPDEEGGEHNGVEWLVQNHRDLIDAQFAINPDSGGGHVKNGHKTFMGMQAAEKVFLSFKLEVTNAGGHSSLPKKDNAIYHLAGGLTRLAAFDFPVHLFDVTQSYFERIANLTQGPVAADMRAVAQDPKNAAVVKRLSAVPLYNALLRTTCIPTMLAGGHAENALPQSATAVVNCRVIPGEKQDDIEKTLARVLDDPQIKISVLTPAKVSPATTMNPQVVSAVTAVTEKHWPGLRVIPEMDTGASDGVYTQTHGIPTYGVNGVFLDEDDIRAHGRDERVPVQAFYDSVDFTYDLVKTLAKNPR